MAIQPDLVGTIDLTGGSTAFTWAGTSLKGTNNIQAGETIWLTDTGGSVIVATVDSATTGTLTDPCPAALAGTAQGARIRYQADLSRVSAQTRQLIERISDGDEIAANINLMSLPVVGS